MFIPVKKLVDLDTQIFCAGYNRDCFVFNMEEWFLVVRLLNRSTIFCNDVGEIQGWMEIVDEMNEVLQFIERE